MDSLFLIFPSTFSIVSIVYVGLWDIDCDVRSRVT